MENNQNTAASGVVLKVRDLDLCRDFYAKVLDLGAPVMDSSFLVEFRCGAFHLFLEKSPWETFRNGPPGNISWFFNAPSPEDVCRRIRAFPVKCSVPEKVIKGHWNMFRCLDPEGNSFYIPCGEECPEEKDNQ